MQNFTTMIVDTMKQENLFASQGGPIIVAQVCEFLLAFIVYVIYIYIVT
jgi:hypothetical protein